VNSGAPLKRARGDALPKSALAKACNYTLTLWQRLIRFLDYPVVELSNNLAENAIRPVALGRRYDKSGIRQSSALRQRDFRRLALVQAEAAGPLVFA
jgi:Transposase IS66 family